MEYRDFRYSNEFGQVDLKRGSIFGIALSWLVIKALHITLVVAFLGTCYATWKYFTADLSTPKVMAPMSPEAVAASNAPPIDYSLHPPQHGATASAAALAGALPPPARPHHSLRQMLHPHGT